MKKLLLLVATIAAMASCSKDTTQDVAPSVVPGTIAVSFDDETRVQLDKDLKTVWTAGDKVSVFYKSDANECWTFQGDTGDRNGNLRREGQGSATTATDKVVIVYPYSESYELDPQNSVISLLVPSVQHYTAESYGVGSNIMVSSGTSNSFALKSVCGWLKLQFSGAGTVTKITLKGNNNNEQLAGKAKIDYENLALSLVGDKQDLDDTQVGGTLIFDDEYATELTLECGGGVDLSAPNVTPFYISLPPVVFEKGFTATLHFDNGTKHNISTAKSVEILRNHIVPMETSEITVPEYDYIDIKNVTSNERIIDNSAKNSSWWATVVSNTYDVENNIGTLVLPKGSSIGDYAFQDVTGLLSIEIPDNMKGYIGSSAFDGCLALKSIRMSANTTRIYVNAFRDCKNLTSINIPDSVTSIGGYAFSGCSSLQGVYITDIAKWCGIKLYVNTDNPLYFAHNLYLNGELVTDLVIPDSVTLIRDYIFYGCSSLTSVNIPDSVISIGNLAFCDCSRLAAFYGKYASSDKRCLIVNGVLNSFAPAELTEYNIPDGVTLIGDWAFSNCLNLTSINIPDGVTSIGDRAFSHCFDLTSVTIGNGVKSIGDYAFFDCYSLTSINIPNGVTSIGSSAFNYCSGLFCFSGKHSSSDKRCLIMNGKLIAFAPYGLTEYIIPDGATSIGDSAFHGCKSLTSITIHDSVTSIGNSAFSYCNSMTSIYCKPIIPPTLESKAFYNISSNAKIYVPAASADAYKTASGWNEYADKIVGYDFNK